MLILDVLVLTLCTSPDVELPTVVCNVLMLDVLVLTDLTNPLDELPTVVSRVLTLVSRPDTAEALVLASVLIALALSLTDLTSPLEELPTVVCNVLILSSLVVIRVPYPDNVVVWSFTDLTSPELVLPTVVSSCVIRYLTVPLVVSVPIALVLSLTDLTNPLEELPTVVCNVLILLALVLTLLTNPFEESPTVDSSCLIRYLTVPLVVSAPIALVLLVIRVSWSDNVDVWSAAVLTNPLDELPTVVWRVLILLVLVLTLCTSPDEELPTVVSRVPIRVSWSDKLDVWLDTVADKPSLELLLPDGSTPTADSNWAIRYLTVPLVVSVPIALVLFVIRVSWFDKLDAWSADALTRPLDASPTVLSSCVIRYLTVPLVVSVPIALVLLVIRVLWSDKLDVWSDAVLTRPLDASPTVVSSCVIRYLTVPLVISVPIAFSFAVIRLLIPSTTLPWAAR